MSKLSVLVVLASVLITVYSLECYQCTNKCDDVSKATKLKCDSSNTLDYRCYKKVEKDKSSGALNTTRGCYILRNENDKSYCNIADPSKTESVFCDICKEDLCNSSNYFKTDLIVVGFVTFGALIGRYFVH